MRNITLGANDSSALVPSESNGVLMKPRTDLRGGLVPGLVAVAVLFATAFAVNAETYSSNPHKSLEAKITAALGEGGGAISVSSVSPTEAEGLLEVTLDNGLVLYATESGDHFVVGDLYAIRKDGLVNLAEQKREQERMALIDGIDVGQMIVFTPEGGARDYITVFTDVTCFYCQKLHREVDELNAKGIEVRYLAYPRGGPDSDGARKLATAWCANDPQETLTQLKAGVTLPTNACDEAPVVAHYQLGASLGVRGTPAIVTSTGQMIPGYKPAGELAQILGLE
jgi:thiol:disulfide interchange protein DsbC